MKRTLDYRRIEVVDEAMARVFREKTPAERVQMVASAFETMKMLIRGRLMTDHPDWSPEQVEQEVARRLLGDAGRSVAAND